MKRQRVLVIVLLAAALGTPASAVGDRWRVAKRLTVVPGLDVAKSAIQAAIAAVASRAANAAALIDAIPASLTAIRVALTAGLRTAPEAFLPRARACYEQLVALTAAGAAPVAACIAGALAGTGAALPAASPPAVDAKPVAPAKP